MVPLKAIADPSSAAHIEQIKKVLSPISENNKRAEAARNPLGAVRLF